MAMARASDFRHLSQRDRRAARHLLALPAALFFGMILLAAGYIAYVLWPRWPSGPVAADAPTLPVSVAGVTFNIPPAAIRQRVQRKPGMQERIDDILRAHRGDVRSAIEMLLVYGDGLADSLSFGYVRGRIETQARLRREGDRS